MRPWNEMYFDGPDPEDFPSIISSVPVTWDYLGSEFKIDFNAGINGVSQKCDSGMLCPEIGWYVTHTPKERDDKETKKDG